MKSTRALNASLMLIATLVLSDSASAQECADDLCKKGCGDVCYRDRNDMQDDKHPQGKEGTGGPIHWKQVDDANKPIPVQYYVNPAALIKRGLNKEEVLNAVKTAFQAWEDLPCSNIKFKFAGETDRTTPIENAILIYWAYKGEIGADLSDSLYFILLEAPYFDIGEIRFAVIALNATPTEEKVFEWSVSPEENKWHIQTFIQWLIPPVVGLNVGNGVEDYSSTQLPLTTGKAVTTICESHKQAMAYVYPNQASSSCSIPQEFTRCAPSWASSHPTDSDGGNSYKPTDPDSGPSSSSDSGTDAGAIDGGLPPSDGDGDGCCRVSHARGGSIPFLTLFGMIVLLALLRQRRR